MHSVDPEIVERIVESLRAGTEDEKLHSAEYACALPEDLFETPVGWDTKRRTANAALTQHGLRAEDLSAIRPTLVTNKIVGGCPASLTRPHFPSSTWMVACSSLTGTSTDHRRFRPAHGRRR